MPGVLKTPPTAARHESAVLCSPVTGPATTLRAALRAVLGRVRPATAGSSARSVTVVVDDPSPPTLRDPSIGVHRFSDRLAARPMDDILRREVDSNLGGALFDWLDRFGTIGGQLVSRAAARLDVSPESVSQLEGFALLDIVDQVIDLASTQLTSIDVFHANDAIKDLKFIFDDHRSLYTIGDVDRMSGRGLVARIDPAVQEAVSHLVGHQTGSAGQHLAAALQALHRIHPDPAASYSDAVRAIEAALGPIVLPNANSPTLGAIKKALLNTNDLASVLDRTGPTGKPPAIPPAINQASQSSVVFLIDLVERIYGTHARHGSDNEYREQTQAQAAAAVYAAVAILGWAQTGHLVRV